MPMGGKGSRFFNDGFIIPKPLIELQGRPFFFWAVQSVAKFIDLADITCVVLKEHVEQFAIDKKIKTFYPEVKIVAIPRVTEGAVLTCLAGLEGLNDGEPLLFNDCDHMFTCESFYAFCRKKDFSRPAAALLTFEAHEPKYSYLEYDDEGRVIRTVEKKAVSSHAICGAYYFKDKKTFADAAALYLKNCSYSEFYLSGVYNVLAQKGAEIRGFETDLHISFGTPEEYSEAVGDSRLKTVM